MTNLSPLPQIPVGECAFFFDVDGTLAEIKPRPEEVCIPPSVNAALQELVQQTQGAVALVSGRPVEELDALISPLILPVAGIHGAEHRDIRGKVHRITLPHALSALLADKLSAALSEMPGTLLEDKGSAFALHYRQVPHYENTILTLARQTVAEHPELVLQPGKCVAELKPVGVSKGEAIMRFMQAAPFQGRQPLFFGDDVTDEAGFKVVNQQGGISVKIGEGPTAAQHRLQNVGALRHWLKTLLLQQSTTRVRSESDESLSRRI